MSRAARGTYRVIAVDKPGYLGETRVFTTLPAAMQFAEGFMQTRKPVNVRPVGMVSCGGPYVLVERKSGYARTEAMWYGHEGAWHKRGGL